METAERSQAAVFDLDGSLLSSDKNISPRSHAALSACRDRGVRLAFATARPPRAVAEYGLDAYGPLICYNGARYLLPGSAILRRHCLSRQLLTELCAFIRARLPGFLINVEVDDLWLACGDIEAHDFFGDWLGPRSASLGELCAAEAEKLFLLDFPELDALRAAFDSRCVIHATDSGRLLQISACGAGKEAAVAELCRAWGIPPSVLICFGDDANDAGLFRFVRDSGGAAIAMDNAIPELKALASRITASNDQDGVALELEKLLGS